jgi:NAD(P)-dependent dehydrogenase (short-subunit alcohol dehydrogenase family)
VPDADILVNNVGTGRMKPFFEIGDSEWTDLFELNVMSGIRASRHHVPNMMKRGWGRVVFINSESALAIPVDLIDYAMTKTAQLAISRGLAEVVGGTGVTVNSVLPGPTNSEIMGGWMKAAAEAQGITQEEAEQQFLNTTRPTTLIKRFATTEEVANLVIYVCSEQASATTGTSLRVDAGVVQTIA